MITVAELRVMLGEGPAQLVSATTPPSSSVWVGSDLIQLVPDVVHPRIYLLCITVELGMVFTRAIPGTPTPSPLRPVTPAGWLPVAEVHVPAHACTVFQRNIKEIRP